MKKILLVGDGGVPTGFERVVRNIGTYLAATGVYEVVQRGIGYLESRKALMPAYPYEIKEAYQTEQDIGGIGSVHRWIEEDKPDVVLMVQDLWNQWNYLHVLPPDMPTVGYFPVDTPNMKWSFATAAAALSVAVPYTKFGAHETAVGVRDAADVLLDGYQLQGVPLTQQADYLVLPRAKQQELRIRLDHLAARQNPEAMPPIGHGTEKGRFYAVDKQKARDAWGIPQDAFVVLSINTNQFRKRQDITIRAFAEFAQHCPKAYLVLHCMAGDEQGWDLAQLARLYGITDRMICTHWAVPMLTEEQLLLLHNIADVHLNTSGGEGWGLTSVESALCGVPQLVPDWSATKELWQGAAMLLPVVDYRFEPRHQLNTAHAIVSASATADRLRYLAENEQARIGAGELCRARALTFPTWDQVGRQFVEKIALAVGDTVPVTNTLQSILDQRTKPLRSTLLAWDGVLAF